MSNNEQTMQVPSDGSSSDAPVSRATTAPEVTARTLADIVVPVFNALADVHSCIDSLLEHCQSPSARIIVVNDGSDAPTTEWLRSTAAGHPMIHLTEHDTNRGYTRAVNTGLRASSAPYVVLMNSDAVVTHGWLAGLVRCAESGSGAGIVGPISNAASWQSVPKLKDDKGFAVNTIPDGLALEDIAQIVRKASTRSYPRTPFVNGFCFLIKRAVIDAIGYMDEQGFPIGYGEENDYCIRAADAGFELAVADDVYVYHSKSRSFGTDRRNELARDGMATLRSKHGSEKVDRLIAQVRAIPVLDALRERVGRALPALQRNRCRLDPLAMKVLFLLPIQRAGGGGAHSVVQEAVAMRRLGVQARIAVRASDHAMVCKSYAEIPHAESLFVGFEDSTLVDVARGYDVCVATMFTTVNLLAEVASAYPEMLPAYYVQDYEPLFSKKGSQSWLRARQSYAQVPGALLFAKTDWICRQVEEEHGVQVHRVRASIDHEVYYPMPRDPGPRLRISAMVRPQTTRRGAPRTMRVLRDVVHRHPQAVEVHVFGCASDDPRFLQLPRDFAFTNHGFLTRPEVAALLRRSDIFIDLSDYQAFGRTGLEAMASGCAVVVPLRGGSDEYAVDGENAVVVDTHDETACAQRLCELVENPIEVRRLQTEGLMTASAYNPHRAAVSEISALARGLAVHRSARSATIGYRLVLIRSSAERGPVTPSESLPAASSRRSIGGGPSWTTDIFSGAELPAPGAADIAVLRGGWPASEGHRLLVWLTGWRRAGGRFVVEADDRLIQPADRDPSPSDNENGALYPAWLASAADAVIVATEDLRAMIQPYNSNVAVVSDFESSAVIPDDYLRVLETLLALPVRFDVPTFPQGLDQNRGWASTPAPSRALSDGARPPREQTSDRRNVAIGRLSKLIRDPGAFMANSRFPTVRTLAVLLRSRPPQ